MFLRYISLQLTSGYCMWYVQYIYHDKPFAFWRYDFPNYYYYYYSYHFHHLLYEGIYTYIPQSNHVPREYSVAAILLLLFMVLISLVLVLNLLNFYISTFRSMCIVIIIIIIIIIIIKPCRSQWPRGLRRRSAAAPMLGLWVRIPPGHGCLSVLSVVCCQVEVSATGWSLVQRSPTDCDASFCAI